MSGSGIETRGETASQEVPQSGDLLFFGKSIGGGKFDWRSVDLDSFLGLAPAAVASSFSGITGSLGDNPSVNSDWSNILINDPDSNETRAGLGLGSGSNVSFAGVSVNGDISMTGKITTSRILSSTSIALELGDKIGNQKVSIKDIDKLEVASIDSTGHVIATTFQAQAVDIINTGSPNDYISMATDLNGDINFNAVGSAEKLKLVGVNIDLRGKLIMDSVLDPVCFNILPRSSEPSSPTQYDVYLDDGTNHGSGSTGFRQFNGVTWDDL